ncbi:MAG: hypothetical protein V1822_04400 [Candidatus Micrarchaeota archaeon]
MDEQYAFWDYGKYVGLNEYELSLVQENMELMVYSILAFFVPFFLAQPQLIVGSIVNFALVLGALNMKGWKILPVILLPSIGVLFAGVIFGGLTPSLVYMVPFIWAGNAILVLSIKGLALWKKMNKALALVVGAILKSAFLFASAYVLFSFGIVPGALLAAMGILQIQTALGGGFAALILHDEKRKFFA